MIKIHITIISVILISLNSFGQNYTQINQVAIQQNSSQINNGIGLLSNAEAINSLRNAIENESTRQLEIEKTQSQLQIIKNLYKDKTVFADIVDGWHLIKITDNFHYCSDVKALVENKEIKKIVLNNYAELAVDFTTISNIKDAKATINWKLPNGDSETAEIYFIYDFDKPSLTSEPIKPGFVTFWSDHSKAKTIKIWINKINQGQLKYKTETGDCFTDGGLTLKLKPGAYEFKAAAAGAMDWRGTIEIKEDQCFTYLLNRSNTD